MNRRAAVAALGVAAFLGLATYSYFSPDLTLRKLREVASKPDVDELRELVDFPAVRESLKEQLRASFTKTLVQKQSRADDSNPFSALGSAIGMMMAGSMIDSMVDSFVSPSAIAEMMRGSKPRATDLGVTEARSPRQASGAETRVEKGYKAYSRYEVRFTNSSSKESELTLILKRNGIFSWRLSDIRFSFPESHPNLFQTPLPGVLELPGGTHVERIVVARSVNADHSPGEAATTFGKSDTVYVSMWTANAPVGTEITARWFGPAGKQLTEDRIVTDKAGDGNTSFHAANLRGWTPGTYRIEILLNGHSVGSVGFSVRV
jgi:hypothetical protein